MATKNFKIRKALILAAFASLMVLANHSVLNAHDLTVAKSGPAALHSADGEPLSVAIASLQNADCAGAGIGQAVLQITGGFAPYRCKVNDGSFALIEGASLTLDNLSEGAYNITVMDEMGEIATTSFTISQPRIAEISSAVVCTGQPATISASVEGGTAPYSYQWKENGSIVSEETSYTHTFNVTTPETHTYQLEVTDVNGCAITGTATITVDIYPAAPAIVPTEGAFAVCPGNGIPLEVETIDPNLTYTWTSTENQITEGTSMTSCPLWVPTYFTLYAVNGSNCATGTTQLVTINDTVKLEATNTTQSLCAGTDIEDIVCTVENATLSIEGALPTGLTLTGNTISGSITTAGDYTFNLKAESDQTPACDTKKVEVHITVNAIPTWTATTTSNTKCDEPYNGQLSLTMANPTHTYRVSLDNGGTFTTFTGTPSFNALAPGNYNIIVIDENTGCQSDVHTVTINSDANNPTVTLADVAACVGAEVVLTPTTSADVVSYEWYAGSSATGEVKATTASYTVTASEGISTYTLRVKNASCYNVTTVAVTGLALPTFTATATGLTCSGGASGEIAIDVTSGTPAFQYSVDNGANWSSDATITGLSGGNYSVTVKDGNGCVATAQTIEVSSPDALSMGTPAVTPVSCFGETDGTITITPTGGTAPYQYSLNGGEYTTSNVFANLAKGNHTAKVKDANGCETAEQTITVGGPDAALALGDASNVLNVKCNGGDDGEFVIAATGGTSPYQYTIDGIYQSSGHFQGLNARTYTVTAKDAHNCTVSKDVVITQPAYALSLRDATVTDVLCHGQATGSFTIEAQGGTADYTYHLSQNGTELQNNSTGAFNNLEAGTYLVTVKDANNCSATKEVTVGGPDAALALSIGEKTDVLCKGAATGTFTISATGGSGAYYFSLTGDADDYTTSNTFSGLTADTYTVYAKDGNACPATINVTITEPADALTLNDATVSNVKCYGENTGSFTIAAQGGTPTYLYAIDGVTFSGSGTFSNLAAGNYTVTAKDDHNCITTKSVTVGQPAAALAVSNGTISDVKCYNGNDGSFSVAVTGGTPTFTYAISPVEGTNANNGTFSGLTAGNYSVTVTDGNNCQKSTSVTISQPAAALAIAGANNADASCNGANNGAIRITVNGGTRDYNYAISPIEGDNDHNGNFTSLPAGDYTVTVTDANNCSLTENYTISQPSALEITSVEIEKESCNGHDGKATVNVTGGTLPYTYAWSNGDNRRVVDTLTSLANGGVYTVTVTDGHDCYVTATVTMELNNPITLSNINLGMYCSGKEFYYLPENGRDGVLPAGTTFSWTIGSLPEGMTCVSGCDTTGADAINGQITNNSGTNRLIEFQVTPANGVCVGTANTSSITITVVETPLVSLSDVGSYTVCPNDGPVALSATIVGGTTDVHSVTWGIAGDTTTNNYTLATQNTSAYNFTVPTTPCDTVYTYTVTYNDGSGCIARDGGTITVKIPAWTIAADVVTDVECVVDATQPTAAQIPTAFDGCSEPLTAVFKERNANINATQQGTIEYVYRYTACDGSYKDWTYKYNVTRSTHPVVADGFEDSKTVDCHAAALVPPTNIPTATDVCGETIDPTGPTVTSTGDECSGTRTYTYTYTDIAGLTSTWSYTYTFNDNAGPEVTGYQTTYAAVVENCTYTYPDVTDDIRAHATDNCTTASSDFTIAQTPAAGSPITIAEDAQSLTITVSIKDKCNNETIVDNITVEVPTRLALTTPAVTDVACFGESTGEIAISATGGNGGYAYTINPDVAPYADGKFSNLAAGTYSVTVTDIKNCTATTVDIVVAQPDSKLKFSTTKQDIVCHGDATGYIHITAEGGTPNYQYSVDNGASWFATANFDDITADLYTVIVKDDHNCATNPQYVTLNQPASLPAVSIAAPVSLCAPATSTIIASGATNYEWSNGANTAEITVSVGTYTVTGTDDDGCKNTATVTITSHCYEQIVITSSSTDWVYDGDPHSDHTYEVTYGGTPVDPVPGTDGLVFVLPTGDTLKITPTANPVTTIGDSGEDNNTFTYTLEHANSYPEPETPFGDLAITKRLIILTANSKEDITYNGQMHTYTETTSPYYTVESDTMLVAGQQITSITITGQGRNVGSYPTNITEGSVAITNADATIDYTANYDITLHPGVLKINKNNADITFGSDTCEKVYDAEPLVCREYFVVYDDDTIRPTIPGNDTTFILPTGDTIIFVPKDSLTDADTIPNTFDVIFPNDTNYTNTPDTVPGKLIVTPRPIILTANSKEFTYDGHIHTWEETDEPHFTVGAVAPYVPALITGQHIADIDITGERRNVGSTPTVITEGSVVIKEGTEDVTDNYNITLYPGVLKINKSNADITFGSDTCEKVYDGTPLVCKEYYIVYDGDTIRPTIDDPTDPNGNDTTFILPTGDTIIFVPKDSLTDADTIPNTFDVIFPNDTNYTNTPDTVPGKLIVTPRPIILTANSKEFTYDGHIHTWEETDEPHFTVGAVAPYVPALITGQHIADIDITGQGRNVGSTPTVITEGSVVIKEGTEDVTANYDITLHPGVLKINKKDVDITFGSDTCEKVYDGTPLVCKEYYIVYDGDTIRPTIDDPTDPDGNDTTFILPTGDTIIFVPKDSLTDADTIPNTFDVIFPNDTNYTNTPDTVPGKLIVTPKPITIEIVDIKVWDGDPLETPYDDTTAVRITGLVPGDSLIAGTITTNGSDPGTYTVGDNTSQITTPFDTENGLDNYAPTYNVTQYIIKPNCPDDITATLQYNKCDTVLNDIGTVTITGTTDLSTTNNYTSSVLMPGATTAVTWYAINPLTGSLVELCTQSIEVQFPPCGVIGDSVADGDGNRYSAVRIGCQCWTGENHHAEHYPTMTRANMPVDTFMKYNDSDSLAAIYGYLYTWYSAVGVDEGDDSAQPVPTSYGRVRGICPDGWAIPTNEEYSIMVAVSGDTWQAKSPSTLYWIEGQQGHLPGSGFNARGAGSYTPNGNHYESLMTAARFWTVNNSTYDERQATYIEFGACETEECLEASKGTGFSVRCIRIK